MSKKAFLDIKESILELKSLLSKQKTLKGEKRLKSLLFIKIESLKHVSKKQIVYLPISEP